MYTMNCSACPCPIRNRGIRAQIDFTKACGLPYSRHDGIGYNANSDVVYMGYNYNVKAYHFTLMSGPMCEGKTTLPEIWDVYVRNTHSNRFVYVVNETAYIMDIDEFKRFVFEFCEIERESNHSDRQRTGAVKVRAKRCERQMVQWFNMVMEEGE